MYYDWYPKSPGPRKAKGGIKARSKRGGFGESWWAKRWIQVLESFNIGGRLSRGRSYARGGQVLSIDIGKGNVKASVQGSRARPYQVSIKIPVLSREEWKGVIDALSSQAVFAAKLTTGEMPDEIEKAFEQAGVSLFPKSKRDISTDCSCPDWSNPCKHIAAVYYIIGEEFDRDPFLLFTLRGMTRDEVMKKLGGETRAARATKETEPLVSPEPLAAEPAAYWGASTPSPTGTTELHPPPVAGALLRRLGGFPFWRADLPIVEALLPSYEAASRSVLNRMREEVGNEGD